MEQKWIAIARSYIGLREYPGAASNPKIIEWARRLGAKVLGIAYTADSVPWCGLFAAHCVSGAGLVPPPIAVRASEWAKWGLSLKVPVQGCIAVFQRPGGGHVGFVVGETKLAYRILGGNQGDAVSYTWIDKSRCVGLRWPSAVPLVKTPPVFYTASGPISRNEA